MKNGILKFIVTGIVFLTFFVLWDRCIGKCCNLLEKIAIKSGSDVGIVKTGIICERIDSDVLIFGSSRAYCHYDPRIMEKEFGLSVFNCGMDGSGFLYQTALIRNLLNRYSPKILIWNLEPDDLREHHSDSKISQLNSYYDSNTYIHDLINLRSKFEKYKMHSMLYRHNGFLMEYISSFFQKADQLKGYRPRHNTGRFPTKGKRNEKADDCSSDSIEKFVYILQSCSEKKISTVIAFSPSFTDDNALETLQCKKLREIANKFNIPIIDFYHYPDFMSDSSLFLDERHLNDNGAKLFTERFCEELEKLEILKSAQTNN